MRLIACANRRIICVRTRNGNSRPIERALGMDNIPKDDGLYAGQQLQYYEMVYGRASDIEDLYLIVNTSKVHAFYLTYWWNTFIVAK